MKKLQQRHRQQRLTSAGTMCCTKTYGARFHESYDTALDDHVVYIGPHEMGDTVAIDGYLTTVGR